MATHLIELKEKRMKAVADARAYLDKAETEKRGMTTEENANYGRALDDAEKISGEINNLERMAKLETDGIVAMPIAKQSAKGRSARFAALPTDTPADLQHKAVSEYIVNYGGMPTIQNALQTAPDSQGGYLLSEQLSQQIIIAVNDEVFIRGLATVETVNQAGGLGIVSVDADPADADWTAEITAVSEDSTMAFGKRELKPNILSKLIKISRRLLNASTKAESLVMERLAYKRAITEEKAFLTGSGVNQPLGCFTASAMGIPTSRDVSTGNTTTAFTVDGLRNAKYSLKGQYLRNATWIFHRDAVKMLSKLKDGDGQYLWHPSLIANAPDMLDGRPIAMSEYAPNTFTTGLYSGMIGDFGWYHIADFEAMSIQRLVELYAASNQVGFILRSETDGMPVLGEAFARVKLA